jgi:hypothetical protein
MISDAMTARRFRPPWTVMSNLRVTIITLVIAIAPWFAQERAMATRSPLNR